MAFTVPDAGEGDDDVQSVLFQEDLDILVAGISGVDCVLSGCAVTGGADMTPAVAKGAVLSNGVLFAVAAGDVTIGAADGTNPRIDLIVVDSTGAKAVRAGTAAAAPKPPARSANDVVLAAVYVPASDTAIASTQIIDKRVVRSQGPIVIAKQTAQRVVNNSVATESLFVAAPVIPDGLFLSGRIIRVRAWGTFLHNNAVSYDVTVRITYGGTVLFQDLTTSFGTSADADLQPWWLDFNIVAQGDAVQVGGGLWLNAGATTIAPNTGAGNLGNDEIAGAAPIGSSKAGIAVDSDAADRVLDVDFDMSVANATNEWVCQGITVELL